MVDWKAAQQPGHYWDQTGKSSEAWLSSENGKPLVLYHNDMSTCANKVRFALAEKGLTQHVEFRNLNIRGGDTHTEAYLALNRGGYVPTLVHEGRVICESNEILRYIDGTFAGATSLGNKVSLTPRDTAVWELQQEWLGRLAKPMQYGGLHAAIAVITIALGFRHQFIAMKKAGNWTPPAKNKEFIEQMMALGDAPSPALREVPAFVQALSVWERCLGDMESALAVSKASTWLCGFQFTLADCAYAPYLIRLEDLGLLGMLDDRPQLRNYLQRLRERESFGEANTPWRNASAIKIFEEQSVKEWPMVQEILQVMRAPAKL